MKPIILTAEAKQRALEIFQHLLEEATVEKDLSIKITAETICNTQELQKPIVFVTAQAYTKMLTLINNTNKELAWHGIATRVNNDYCIEDILVYPQTVTSATVDADEDAYAKWLMDLPDDVINNLRFQGHSHCKMPTSPSGRDTTNWEKFVNLIEPDDFYIFCIGNQNNSFYWNIYDKRHNVLFENKDIEMCIIDERGNSIDDWCAESIDKYIKEEKPVITYTRGGVGNNPVGFRTPDTSPLTLNGKSYATAPSKNAADSVKDAKAHIPKEMKDIVQYEAESDIYFIEQADIMNNGIPDGFYYSNLYDCSIMSGVAFRRRYPKAKKNNTDKKNKKGR